MPSYDTNLWIVLYPFSYFGPKFFVSIFSYHQTNVSWLNSITLLSWLPVNALLRALLESDATKSSFSAKINYKIMVMNMTKRESKTHESFKFASRNISIRKNFRTPWLHWRNAQRFLRNWKRKNVKTSLTIRTDQIVFPILTLHF